MLNPPSARAGRTRIRARWTRSSATRMIPPTCSTTSSPPAPLSEDELADVRADLVELAEFRGVLEPVGVHGIIVECGDCGELHYFGWELMAANLTRPARRGTHPRARTGLRAGPRRLRQLGLRPRVRRRGQLGHQTLLSRSVPASLADGAAEPDRFRRFRAERVTFSRPRSLNLAADRDRARRPVHRRVAMADVRHLPAPRQGDWDWQIARGVPRPGHVELLPPRERARPVPGAPRDAGQGDLRRRARSSQTACGGRSPPASPTACGAGCPPRSARALLTRRSA